MSEVALSPESGAPVAPAVPSPEQGALDAQQVPPDSSPAGEDTSPEAEPQDPEEYRRSAKHRIGELTFDKRRAERVAAEAVQENLALRQWIDMQSRGQPAPPVRARLFRIASRSPPSKHRLATRTAAATASASERPCPTTTTPLTPSMSAPP